MGKPLELAEKASTSNSDEEELEGSENEIDNCSCWIYREGSPTLRYFRLMPLAIAAVRELHETYDVEEVIWEQAKEEFIIGYRDFIETITKCARPLRQQPQ